MVARGYRALVVGFDWLLLKRMRSRGRGYLPVKAVTIGIGE
jgi:hypothetical protein